MSHAHRDEHDLAQPVVDEPAPVVAPPAPALVANTEAERRAAERRKAEGVPEQAIQRQFTGDLPEPDRGGTDTETRLVFGDGADDGAAATGEPAASVRRGPPPPHARLVADEHSWVAPPTLDTLGSSTLAVEATGWLARPADRDAVMLRHTHTHGWSRS